MWALCHSCVTWLWVKKYTLPGVLVCAICLFSIQASLVSSVPAPYRLLPSPSSLLCSLIPVSFSVIPSLASCIPPSFSCGLPHLCLPPLVFISILLVQLPIPHFSPAPGLCISCVLLAYLGSLTLFLIPVSVQVCKVISAEEQTGFYSRKCWTIQGVGGAHSTTYNLEHCLYF